MNRGDRRTGNDGHDGRDAGMMAMMMAMCVGVLLLVVVLPTLGFPLGLLVAIGAAVLMFVLHARFMNHGGGR